MSDDKNDTLYRDTAVHHAANTTLSCSQAWSNLVGTTTSRFLAE
jgi:hypothetical protein